MSPALLLPGIVTSPTGTRMGANEQLASSALQAAALASVVRSEEGVIYSG